MNCDRCYKLVPEEELVVIKHPTMSCTANFCPECASKQLAGNKAKLRELMERHLSLALVYEEALVGHQP